VEIKDPVSGYLRTTNTNSEGAFRFTNVPFNPYHLSVNANGFAAFARDVEVRSVVPTKTEIGLTYLPFGPEHNFAIRKLI
jgi:hypothetical protein